MKSPIRGEGSTPTGGRVEATAPYNRRRRKLFFFSDEGWGGDSPAGKGLRGRLSLGERKVDEGRGGGGVRRDSTTFHKGCRGKGSGAKNARSRLRTNRRGCQPFVGG